MKTYNKIKTLFVASLACIGLVSCGDFLEIEPKTFVSENNFWNEKSDVDNMVTGVYTKLQSSGLIERCIMWGETRSDNITDGLNCERDDKNIYRTLQEQLLETNPYCNWQPFYAVINQCNTIITRAPEVSKKDPAYIESDMRATQAEMAFIRDLCYFYLVRAYKDVPYYTYPIESDEEAQPIAATSGDEIVKNLIADLDSMVNFALKAYPKIDPNNDGVGKKYNSNCNRTTRNAIYALLADLCLWDGQYQRCIDYSQKVIDAKVQEYYDDFSTKQNQSTTIMIVDGVVFSSSSNVELFKWAQDTGQGYPLIPCYSGSSSTSAYGADFNSIFGGNGNSFESLFELCFNPSTSESGYLSNWGCARLYGNYLPKDGTVKANEGKGYLGVADEVYGDLPNKAYKVFRNEYDCRFYTSLTPEKPDEYTSAFAAKYVKSSVSVTANSNSNRTLSFISSSMITMSSVVAFNWIFYRLTDVMLMQAEALIELDPSEENLRRAFCLIYAVNRRSIMVPSTASTSVVTTNELKFTDNNNQDAMRELCKAERRRELMFEGKRWFDMLRYYRRSGRLDQIPQKAMAEKITNPEKLYWPYYYLDLRNNENLDQKAAYGQQTDNEEIEEGEKPVEEEPVEETQE